MTPKAKTPEAKELTWNERLELVEAVAAVAEAADKWLLDLADAEKRTVFVRTVFAYRFLRDEIRT